MILKLIAITHILCNVCFIYLLSTLKRAVLTCNLITYAHVSLKKEQIINSLNHLICFKFIHFISLMIKHKNKTNSSLSYNWSDHADILSIEGTDCLWKTISARWSSKNKLIGNNYHLLIKNCRIKDKQHYVLRISKYQLL